MRNTAHKISGFTVHKAVRATLHDVARLLLKYRYFSRCTTFRLHKETGQLFRVKQFEMKLPRLFNTSQRHRYFPLSTVNSARKEGPTYATLHTSVHHSGNVYAGGTRFARSRYEGVKFPCTMSPVSRPNIGSMPMKPLRSNGDLSSWEHGTQFSLYHQTMDDCGEKVCKLMWN